MLPAAVICYFLSSLYYKMLRRSYFSGHQVTTLFTFFISKKSYTTNAFFFSFITHLTNIIHCYLTFFPTCCTPKSSFLVVLFSSPHRARNRAPRSPGLNIVSPCPLIVTYFTISFTVNLKKKELKTDLLNTNKTRRKHPCFDIFSHALSFPHSKIRKIK